MQLTPCALLAAAAISSSSSGVLASSAADLIHEIRGSLHGAAAAGSLLMTRQSKNLQSFTGALGGIKADAVTETNDSQRPFSVEGETFPDFATAAGRSCDNQKNACAKMANGGGVDFSVGDCDNQNAQCKASIDETISASSSASSTSTSTSTSTSSSSSTLTTTSNISTTSSATLALVSQNAEFNFFCEV